MNTKPEAFLVALVALVIIASATLSGLGAPVPDWFRDVGFVALGAGGGVAVPRRTQPGDGAP